MNKCMPIMTSLVLDASLTPVGACCAVYGSNSKSPTCIKCCIYTIFINRFKSLCGVAVYGCLSLVSNHLTNE